MKDNNKLKNNKTRTVKDTMGNIKVPLNAEYAAQTQRAVNNFTVSNQKFTSDFIYPIVIIKLEAAKTNYKLKLINKDVCNAIVKACKEILNSKYDNQFPVDVYQTGSGTSTNMNVNEVISSIANKIIKNKSIKIHPNDHVNLGQSSNDVIPAAISVSASLLIEKSLIPAFMISELRRAFEIGFLVFVPFLVIDMVVASVLMSMGMMMLPPIIIALPFKIVFFVLVDGWFLISGSLLESFGGS